MISERTSGLMPRPYFTELANMIADCESLESRIENPGPAAGEIITEGDYDELQSVREMIGDWRNSDDEFGEYDRYAEWAADNPVGAAFYHYVSMTRVHPAMHPERLYESRSNLRRAIQCEYAGKALCDWLSGYAWRAQDGMIGLAQPGKFKMHPRKDTREGDNE